MNKNVVWFIIALLCTTAYPYNERVDKETNVQVSYAVQSVVLETDSDMDTYTMRWNDGKKVTAYHWHNTGNWSFNVHLEQNRYYQVSCDEDGCKGALSWESCERIKELIKTQYK